DALMKEGEMTGAEYFAVRRGLPNALVGVEDAKLYNVHRDLFRRTLAGRRELASELRGIRGELRLLSRRLFSPELRRLQQVSDAFEDGQVELDALVRELN